MNLSFQKLFYALFTVIALFTILILAKSILIPFSFALLFSFILFPLAKRFEKIGINTTLSGFLALVSVIVLVIGIMVLFSTEFISLSKDMNQFRGKILSTFADITYYANNNLRFVGHIDKNELYEKLNSWWNESSGSLIKQTFSNTTEFLTGLFTSLIFTLMILIYREGIVRALVSFAKEDNRAQFRKMLKSIQHVGQKYLFGMLTLITIIGFANTLGLWLIGIENPFFFGFFASVLAIVPYVGTLVGATIPIFYAYLSFDSLWIPIAVAILFWSVQLITDNLLSPKIMGDSLQLNALTALLSLFIGASVWGIAGMILFLPFAAILRVICENYDELKPLAMLMGSSNYQETKKASVFSKFYNSLRNKRKK